MKNFLDLIHHELSDFVVTANTNRWKPQKHEGGAYALLGSLDDGSTYVVEYTGSRVGLIEMWQYRFKSGKHRQKEVKSWVALRFHKTSRGLQAKEVLLWGFWEATEGW